MDKIRQQEVDANYDAFLKELPSLVLMQNNKFALMKNREVLGFYSSAEDAAMAAESFIKDGIFSIQHVTQAKVDLGFFNYAVAVH